MELTGQGAGMAKSPRERQSRAVSEFNAQHYISLMPDGERTKLPVRRCPIHAHPFHASAGRAAPQPF